jgi:nucleoside 2-deoxyribosyltransferase
MSRGIYVASPNGFTEPGRRYNAEVVAAVRAAGYEVLDPWEVDAEVVEAGLGALALAPGSERAAAMARLNERVGRDNEEAIRAATGVLAVLDGTDVDSGTASEVGFAFALGLPIVGLRTDLRATGDNEAAVVNLQVEYFIRASGGTIVTSLDAAVAALTDVVAVAA